MSDRDGSHPIIIMSLFLHKPEHCIGLSDFISFITFYVSKFLPGSPFAGFQPSGPSGFSVDFYSVFSLSKLCLLAVISKVMRQTIIENTDF